MVARKKTTTKTGSSMANVDAAIQAELDTITEKIQAPTGKTIKFTNDGVHFDVPGLGLVESPMQVVIAAFTNRNDFYEGDFSIGAFDPPSCFAINEKIDDMVPDETVPHPVSETCYGCELNQFGSKGKGKACKNQIIVAVLPPADPNADILVVKVSPKGLKAFSGMISALATRWAKVPMQVIAQMDIRPAGQSYTIEFSLATDSDGAPILNPDVHSFFARVPEARNIVAAKPDMTEKEKKAPVVKRGASRKKVTPGRRPAAARSR